MAKTKDSLDNENNSSESNISEISKEKKVKKSSKKGDKKSKAGIIVFFIFFLIILTAAVMLYFNIANLREGTVFPILRKIPIVQNLIPPVNSEGDTEGTQTEDIGLSSQELIEKVSLLEQELASKDSEIERLNTTLDDNKQEISRLKEFESQQNNFKEEKEEFDRMIALNDPNAYKAYYESISPENAGHLYQDASQLAEENAVIQNYVSTFNEMKPAAVAPILEELILSDMTLVVQILSRVNTDQCAKIIAAMSPANAATVTKQLAPEVLLNMNRYNNNGE